jgi:hypothetical protein
MTTTTRWTAKLPFAVAALALGLGTLEMVGGAMMNADPATLAQRQQSLQARFDRLEAARMIAADVHIAEPAQHDHRS